MTNILQRNLTESIDEKSFFKGGIFRWSRN
jgi:hypothetical protein